MTTQPSLFEKMELPTLRRLPETSIAAYKMAVNEMKVKHYLKIYDALKKLGSANYEKIAEMAGLDKHQVGRRLSELEREQKVYKPGIQTLTKSGRRAFNYCLTNEHYFHFIFIYLAIVLSSGHLRCDAPFICISLGSKQP